MKHQPAPEPYRSAYLYLLYRVALFLRNKADDGLSGEQALDLGDAIHNIPEFINLSGFAETEFRNKYLKPYDEKWADTDSFSLIATIERYLSEGTCERWAQPPAAFNEQRRRPWWRFW